MQPGNDKYLSDFAMILVNENSKTGWFGTEWDWQGAYKTATKIGYPVGIARGEVIQVLPGPISVSEGIVELRHGDPNKQGGSSGGAWVADYDTQADPKHDGIHHRVVGFEDSRSLRPYFDDRVKQLYDHVSNGCNGDRRPPRMGGVARSGKGRRGPSVLLRHARRRLPLHNKELTQDWNDRDRPEGTIGRSPAAQRQTRQQRPIDVTGFDRTKGFP